jgi:serine/threonine-protein kinase
MPPPTPKDKTTLEIGQLLGHSKQFRLAKLLGRGGFGEVYLASEERADRVVAIKVLRPEHNGDEKMLKRFKGEYTLANLLSHPSMVKMFDLAETPEGLHYIVMEYLDGVLLSARLTEKENSAGRLGLGSALILGWQISSVLAQLHVRALIHRDLKPGNIVLVPDPDAPGGERVKLLDFGISKLTDGKKAKALNVEFNTTTGVQLGTVSFMAPEHFISIRGGNGHPSDHAAYDAGANSDHG